MASAFQILTARQVSAIKRAIFGGADLAELAKRYGVGKANMSHIKMGRVWPHIPWPNGSTGALAEERRIEIVRLRMADKAKSMRKEHNSAHRSKAKPRGQKAAKRRV